MKLIIAGSRYYYVAHDLISKLLKDKELEPKEIVSGKAQGIDTCGEKWAEIHQIPVTPFPYLKEKGKAGGPLRNQQMADYADALVAFPSNGNGTWDMIKRMQTANKPVYVYSLSKERWLNPSEFEAERELPNPKDDGVTHINIYSKGQTRLGHLLSNFAFAPINTPNGKFSSIEGYWYWLLSNRDAEAEKLRQLYNFEAKLQGRNLRIPDWPLPWQQDEFKRDIKEAMKAKVEQHPDIKALLLASDLPFKHYYIYGDRVVVVKNCGWILDYWEELRNVCRL